VSSPQGSATTAECPNPLALSMQYGRYERSDA